jgi:hypothetical protein
LPALICHHSRRKCIHMAGWVAQDTKVSDGKKIIINYSCALSSMRIISQWLQQRGQGRSPLRNTAPSAISHWRVQNPKPKTQKYTIQYTVQKLQCRGRERLYDPSLVCYFISVGTPCTFPAKHKPKSEKENANKICINFFMNQCHIVDCIIKGELKMPPANL